MGIKFEDYPEIERWYEQCRELPGFDENEEGAKVTDNFLLKSIVQLILLIFRELLK